MSVNAIFNSNGRGAISKYLFRPITDKGYSAKWNFRFHDFCELRPLGFLENLDAASKVDFSHLEVKGIDTLPTPLHNKR
jgi:hypothetical protein